MNEKVAEKQKKEVKQSKPKKGGLVAKVNKKGKKAAPKQKNANFWQNFVLGSALLALICLLVFAYNVYNSTSFSNNVAEIQVLSQQVLNDVEEAAITADPAEVKNYFVSIKNDHTRLKSLFADVEAQGGADESLASWKVMDKSLSNIIKNQNALVSVDELSIQVSEDIPEIQVHYNDAINQMLQAGVGSQQVLLAKNQIILSERILRSVNTITSTRRNSFGSADDFKADTDQIGVVLDGQINGNPELGISRVENINVREKLDLIQEIFKGRLNPQVQKIYENAPALNAIRNDTATLAKENSNLATQFKKLDTSVFGNPIVWVPALLLLIGLLALAYGLFQLSVSRRAVEDEQIVAERERQRKETEAEMMRAAKIQEENDRNQSAILRLLDELGDLADGDLTVNATVSEDFTGAIADSVNFAIDQLRQLVSAINRTAISVAGSSEDTQSTAMQLAESSEHQAQEIAGASAAINEMAVSIDQVSANAVESATVADRSVAIAYNGAEVVQRTIDGMNTIREQIQETSKRIKRLGESSQEIGDIISLINDIADQTNILALNAAIQASSAGEAGRGFAVVADEVQRLAERSANATKQIESLVKTIQSDTNEAVSSMELTTSEVVKGAKLAKDAGEALEEVQTVSNTLADLIQNISNAARQQAASAGHISNTMNIIQEITTQTTAGTIATARSVGQLNEMAVSLRESVSGFTLPDEDGAIALANA